MQSRGADQEIGNRNDYALGRLLTFNLACQLSDLERQSLNRNCLKHFFNKGPAAPSVLSEFAR